jgi:hypothetical protein
MEPTYVGCYSELSFSEASMNFTSGILPPAAAGRAWPGKNKPDGARAAAV